MGAITVGVMPPLGELFCCCKVRYCLGATCDTASEFVSPPSGSEKRNREFLVWNEQGCHSIKFENVIE